jgi:hypothetical protein
MKKTVKKKVLKEVVVEEVDLNAPQWLCGFYKIESFDLAKASLNYIQSFCWVQDAKPYIIVKGDVKMEMLKDYLRDEICIVYDDPTGELRKAYKTMMKIRTMVRAFSEGWRAKE